MGSHFSGPHNNSKTIPSLVIRSQATGMNRPTTHGHPVAAGWHPRPEPRIAGSSAPRCPIASTARPGLAADDVT